MEQQTQMQMPLKNSWELLASAWILLYWILHLECVSECRRLWNYLSFARFTPRLTPGKTSGICPPACSIHRSKQIQLQYPRAITDKMMQKKGKKFHFWKWIQGALENSSKSRGSIRKKIGCISANATHASEVKGESVKAGKKNKHWNTFVPFTVISLWNIERYYSQAVSQGTIHMWYQFPWGAGGVGLPRFNPAQPGCTLKFSRCKRSAIYLLIVKHRYSAIDRTKRKTPK